MGTVAAGQWTPGLPVANATLAQQMSIALNFVTQPGSVVTAGPVSLYSLTQGLVSHYGLACGQPGYQAVPGHVLEASHNAFVAKFKPAAARAFSERLGGMLRAEKPVELYQGEGLSDVDLPDMARAGLLTFVDVRNFSRQMADLTAQNALRILHFHEFVGRPYSVSAMASRLFLYLAVLASGAVLAHVVGYEHYMLSALGITGGLLVVGELSSALISCVASHILKSSSISAALDIHVAAVRAAEDAANAINE